MVPYRLSPLISFSAVFSVSALLLLPACASNDNTRSGLFEPYRFDIPQGNYITADAIAQVKVGMSREQVRAVLGTPLIVDTFRTNRWDYVFHYLHANGKSESRRAAVMFDKERVLKIDATQLPATEASDDPVLRRGRIAAPKAG